MRVRVRRAVARLGADVVHGARQGALARHRADRRVALGEPRHRLVRRPLLLRQASGARPSDVPTLCGPAGRRCAGALARRAHQGGERRGLALGGTRAPDRLLRLQPQAGHRRPDGDRRRCSDDMGARSARRPRARARAARARSAQRRPRSARDRDGGGAGARHRHARPALRDAVLLPRPQRAARLRRVRHRVARARRPAPPRPARARRAARGAGDRLRVPACDRRARRRPLRARAAARGSPGSSGAGRHMAPASLPAWRRCWSTSGGRSAHRCT